MLPRLEGISAAAVLDRLSLLKYRNAHGSHIYIRPAAEPPFPTLDDLNETSLARLSADGFNPCAVVETSAGNFQAWLKHSRVFPKLLGTFAAQTLAERYDADPSAADWRRFGRLPGFTNCKPKYRKSDGLFPFVRLHSHSGHPHRPPRTERRSQNRSEQQRVRHPQHRNPGKLEKRQGRIRNPHRMASRLRLEESLEVRQDAPEGAAHHPGWNFAVSRG